MNKAMNFEEKVLLMSEVVDWNLLEHQLAHHFEHEAAPPLRLVIGLLYLKVMCNASYDGILNQWDSSPLLQSFCGMSKGDLTQPIRPATLSIWGRELGLSGIYWMREAITTTGQVTTFH